MAAPRVSAFRSVLTTMLSRRAALSVLGGLGFAGRLGPSAAKKRKKRKKARRSCPICPAVPPPPPSPVCTSENHCAAAATCQVEGDPCFCWSRADVGHIGEPFCGQGFTDDVLRCSACSSPTVCVILGGDCGGLFACVLPCANPQ